MFAKFFVFFLAFSALTSAAPLSPPQSSESGLRLVESLPRLSDTGSSVLKTRAPQDFEQLLQQLSQEVADIEGAFTNAMGPGKRDLYAIGKRSESDDIKRGFGGIRKPQGSGGSPSPGVQGGTSGGLAVDKRSESDDIKRGFGGIRKPQGSGGSPSPGVQGGTAGGVAN